MRKKFLYAFTNNFEITFKNWWELNGGVNVGKEYENANFYNIFNYNLGFHTDWRNPLMQECGLEDILAITLMTEGVYTDEDKRFIQLRFGGILSFMTASKSWLYIIINDLESYEETRYIPYERIYIAKLRYLFYF